MIVRLYMLLLALSVPLCSAAQYTTHTLTGTVNVQDEGVYKYKVVFTTVGNLVLGYSTTWLPYPGVPQMTTDIRGTINKTRRTFTFKESIVPKSPLQNACYFDVRLKWDTVDNHLHFSGTFVGHDDKGKYCDEGTMTLDMEDDTDPMFAIKKPPRKIRDTIAAQELHKPVAMKQPSKKKKDTVKTLLSAPVQLAPAPAQIIKITAAAQKEFEWRSDSCILEIWDGEYVDGDVVTVLFNGDKVLEHYVLQSDKKRLLLAVHAKINKVSVIAENEGRAPPNTAQVDITDGALTYSMLSSLHTGDTATIILKRKKSK